MDPSSVIIIREASSPGDWTTVRALLHEYADWLATDLSFQNFEHEISNLPEMYGPPGGRMLVADREGGISVGCVGLRRFRELTCEMKRLYVRPDCRGAGLGRRLVLAIMSQGRALGYERMRLDTLPKMTEAQQLYQSLGFHPIPPYGVDAVPGTQFLEAELDPR